MTYDLLIKGGTVVDPSQGLDAILDVALSDGKIAAVQDSIPENDAREVVDAGGMIVTPGLIDLHVHAYWGVCCYGIEPDVSNISKGVTTAMDCGSAGARTFPAFRRYVIERADTRLYALLNISAMGIISDKIGELQDPRWADVDEAITAGRQNRDLVLGIKVRLDNTVTGEDKNAKVNALKRGLEAAEGTGGLLMMHVGDEKTPLEALTTYLRPGDVVTHAFRQYGGIVGAGRQISDEVKEARARGVLFDVGHGAGSFNFDSADHALADGFFPDSISSDVSSISVEGPVFDLVTTMSKFIYLGLPLSEVVRLSTEAPAKIMGVDDRLGTLKVGAEGDVTLLRLDDGRFEFTDAQGVTVEASQKLSHVRTVKGGKVHRPWLR